MKEAGLEHLFRREAGRMTATLLRVLGPVNLALAEDAVQDALVRALETWRIRGVPEAPAAWLMAAARNRAIDQLRRERTARFAEPQLVRELERELEGRDDPAAAQDLRFGGELADAELRTMFSCCHPRIAEEGQVALILQLLCGFSVREIAAAFLSSEATVGKRIERARETLAASGSLYEVKDPAQVLARLPAVLRATYLLFNEGYHGANPEEPVRAELCAEALRLCGLLLRNAAAALPQTLALYALMCLHLARLPARSDAAGDLIQLAQQDRSRWDRELIAEGLAALEGAARGDELSEFHLEAAIAAEHALAASWAETRWAVIVGLYDLLYRARPSPIIGLNRAIAIAQRDGPARGIEELQAIPDREQLARYPFYPAAMAELQLRAGRPALARDYFLAALRLSRNPPERRLLQSRLAALVPQEPGFDAADEDSPAPTGPDS